MNKKEILQKISENKPFLLQSFSVIEIGLFGSYIRNEQTSNSVIDILVDFNQKVDFFKFLELEEYLQNLLGNKVDLVPKKNLKPVIGKIILSEVEYI
ncbi:MAG: nucleotidyltransferase family protein [Bacteroidota bacterium]|nr:nucleotidyltransferase family protein [Bacteroidota bacterium]